MGRRQPSIDNGFRSGAVLLIAAAHFVHDVFGAFIAPLLPLLIRRFGLSLTQAGLLAVLPQLPSLLNPLLGSLVDRRRIHRWLVILAPGLTGTTLCLIGMAPSYAALVVLLLTTGIGVAAIHVAAPVLISGLSGRRVGRGMSFFMVGGELARTLGPLIAVQAVSGLSLDGLWQLIPVALASSLILAWRLRDRADGRPTERSSNLLVVWRGMRRLLLAVTGILLARAFMVGALTVFLPTLLYGEGESLWTANLSLALLELGGVLGAALSGTLSDLVGRRRVLFGAILLSPPLMLLFLATDGWVRFVVLVVLGCFALSTTPVLLAVTLENAGANRAAANGTYMMVSFAARSLIVLAVGAMGDLFGLREAYLWCALLAGLGLPFIVLLPPSNPERLDRPRGGA